MQLKANWKHGSQPLLCVQDLMSHLSRVAATRWGHAIADDFFSKQLPHNVTWGLTLLYALDRSGDFEQGSAAQGRLVDKMRYLASVVTTCFTSFGELLALTKRFNEISGGMQRWVILYPGIHFSYLLIGKTSPM